MAQYVLVYTTADGSEEQVELELGRTYRIGSRRDNDLVIEQKDVSRHHAVLETMSDGRFHVTDLGSKNGTFVNGNKTAASELRCGDQLAVSSVRMVLLEISSGFFPLDPSSAADSPMPGGEGREDTVQFRGHASIAELVELLELVAGAIARGALAQPLRWAVERLGVLGVMVLYRGEDDGVAMVSSAGDLGPFVAEGAAVGKLVRAHKVGQPGAASLLQVQDLGEQLLLASTGPSHVMVIRYADDPPAVDDVRALRAATGAILEGSGSRGLAHDGPGSSAMPPDLERLGEMQLEEARDHFERWMVAKALGECAGVKTLAAGRLGMSRAGLIKKMKRLKVQGVRT